MAKRSHGAKIARKESLRTNGEGASFRHSGSNAPYSGLYAVFPAVGVNDRWGVAVSSTVETASSN